MTVDRGEVLSLVHRSAAVNQSVDLVRPESAQQTPPFYLAVFQFDHNVYFKMTDGRLLFSGFQALVTLTLYQITWHRVVHQSSTSIYIPNVIEIGTKTFFVDGLTAGPLQVQGQN